MIKQASLITGLVLAAAVVAGPAWPLGSIAGAHDVASQTPQLNEKEQILLSMHNEERAVFGSEALTWNAQLAEDALDWAQSLAKRNVMQHSSYQARGGAGENLWMGTRGRYTPQQMIKAFIDEKKDFKPGAFPDVTKTGNWADVGHYTQLVWPETQEVGCAIAENRMDEFLVCRYMPAGNFKGVVIGKKQVTPEAPKVKTENAS